MPTDSGEIVTTYLKQIFQDFLHPLHVWLVLGKITKTKTTYSGFFWI